MSAAAHKPTSADLHRRECSAMADPLSLALQPAYGPEVLLSWDPPIMCDTITFSAVLNRPYQLTMRVHQPFTDFEV